MTDTGVRSSSAWGRPRVRAIVTVRPSKLRAAVTPRATTVAGFTRPSSRSSHHLQCSISSELGRLCKPRLPRLSNLKMLDRVGDEDAASRVAGVAQRAVEDMPGRPDEGSPDQILAVARLLADQHQPRPCFALARHDLRRRPIERAAAAIRGAA